MTNRLIANFNNIIANLTEATHDSDFQGLHAFMKLFSKVKGKYVVTGVGKSQIVGQKLVATLNALSFPAVLLDPNNALHGDVGVVAPNDLVIFISKSGNSNLLLSLVQHLQHIGITTCGITHNPNASLSNYLNACIILPKVKEGDEHDLIPSTSILLQLAFCDALAFTLRQPNLDMARDFVTNHPGGHIGLYHFNKVSFYLNDIIRASVYLDTPLPQCILQISKSKKGAVPVLKDDKVVGIITDGDLRRFFEKNVEFSNSLAMDIYSSNPKCIDINSLAAAAFDVMSAYKISQLIVTDDDKFVGVLHIHDLIAL